MSAAWHADGSLAGQVLCGLALKPCWHGVSLHSLTGWPALQIRLKPSTDVLLAWLQQDGQEHAQLHAPGGRLRIAAKALLTVGAKSLTHLTTFIGRYRMVLQALLQAHDTEVGATGTGVISAALSAHESAGAAIACCTVHVDIMPRAVVCSLTPQGKETVDRCRRHAVVLCMPLC